MSEQTPAAAESANRLRVIVVFGGQSAEHDVSRVSAVNVLNALDPRRYDVVAVGIGRDGVWRLVDATAGATVAATAGATVGAVATVDTGGLTTDGTPIDVLAQLRAWNTEGDRRAVVLPVLHGPNGEDGTIQGLLELTGIAYAGSGVLGSAVSMDKEMSKIVLGAAGIAQAAFRTARRWELDAERVSGIADDLGFPLFVKPANMGSSVGVSKATDRAALDAAVTEALRYDEVVIFEEAITGRELEIAVLGNEAPRASVPGEIVAGAEFYSYDDKYRDGAATTIVPADLPPGAADEMAALALRTYAALRAEGLARVDMFYDEGGRGFLVNEINTFPGFTPISMFPMMWQASGLSYPELLDEMIRLALDRHERRSAHRP